MVGSLHGLRIDRDVFRNSVMSIMNNPGDCKEWPHSAGILTFMIAEAGRFFPVDRVLRTLMCVDLSNNLDNEYQWLAEIPHKWWLFSKWDRELKAMGVNQRDETKVVILTNEQFRELTDRIKDAKDASHAPFKKQIRAARVSSTRHGYQREKKESKGLKFWEMEQRDIEWNISHRKAVKSREKLERDKCVEE
nr:hypothetical protein [Tanacetum cinerariifolium]